MRSFEFYVWSLNKMSQNKKKIFRNAKESRKLFSVTQCYTR